MGRPGTPPETGAASAAARSTDNSIDLANGESAVCSVNNDDEPATLTLVKTVTNDNGGTAAATAWTLSAAGPSPISGPTASGAVTAVPVSAGTYTLSESNGPAGYTAGNWACDAGTLTDDSLVLPNGVSATCTINNDDVAATLTLVKQVVNDNGGTALPTDWTLEAVGPTAGISGPTGDDAVTAVPVSAGAYDLSETGPAGYAASAWSCVGGSLSGSSVTLALGQSATCTITNDDIPATLTLLKEVVNDNGGTAVTTDFLLAGIPEPAIPGQDPVVGPGGVNAHRCSPAPTSSWSRDRPATTPPRGPVSEAASPAPRSPSSPASPPPAPSPTTTNPPR